MLLTENRKGMNMCSHNSVAHEKHKVNQGIEDDVEYQMRNGWAKMNVLTLSK